MLMAMVAVWTGRKARRSSFMRGRVGIGVGVGIGIAALVGRARCQHHRHHHSLPSALRCRDTHRCFASLAARNSHGHAAQCVERTTLTIDIVALLVCPGRLG